MWDPRPVLQAVHLLWRDSRPTTRCGVICSVLLGTATGLFPWLRTFPWNDCILPLIAVNNLVWYSTLLVAAGLWFRVRWRQTPNQPSLWSWRTSRRIWLRTTGWAIVLSAAVTTTVYTSIFLAFSIPYFTTQTNLSLLDGVINSGGGFLVAIVLISLIFVPIGPFLYIATIGTVVWATAASLRRRSQSRVRPRAARPLVQ
jgi:hypothetical protein